MKDTLINPIETTNDIKEDIHCRTQMLLGKDAVEKLKKAKIAVIGLGGVGGSAAEALARSGVGRLLLIDFDTLSETNLNRQLFALRSVLGEYKTDVAKKRIEDINPECRVSTLKIFIDEKALNDEFVKNELLSCDYVIDAIDSVASKVSLAVFCNKNSLHEISCMGTGNRTDITKLKVCDIYSTHDDPLARAIRPLLKKADIKSLKCVFSDEAPLVRLIKPSSMIFVPCAAGLIAARNAVYDVISV